MMDEATKTQLRFLITEAVKAIHDGSISAEEGQELAESIAHLLKSLAGVYQNLKWWQRAVLHSAAAILEEFGSQIGNMANQNASCDPK